jgi:hypothetical protein
MIIPPFTLLIAYVDSLTTVIGSSRFSKEIHLLDIREWRFFDEWIHGKNK